MADSAAGPLGIVAGSGGLPRRLIDQCRAQGRAVFVLALDGEANPITVAGVPHAWCRLGAAASAFDVLRAAGVGELVLAGGVQRPSIASLRPDWRAAKFFARVGLRAFGDDALLTAVIKEIEQEGFRVIGPDVLLAEAGEMPEGPLGAVRPDAQATADTEHGLHVAQALGALDIGQSVVVQQGMVLGVEAIEGTDALMRRCAALQRPGLGGVLVKAEKPGQERRVDQPVIGPHTVAVAAEVGLRGIAGRGVLLLDRAEVVRAADAAGLFVVGVPRAS